MFKIFIFLVYQDTNKNLKTLQVKSTETKWVLKMLYGQGKPQPLPTHPNTFHLTL